MESTQSMKYCSYIFGGDRMKSSNLGPDASNNSRRPWNSSQWIDVDDRVRGGSSVSHLDISDPKSRALFRGNLDIKTLGGAGFASQRTVSELFGHGLDLSDYELLVIDIIESASDDKTYTLILKDTEPLPKRPDGREQSTVNWEHDFRLGSSSGGRAVMRLEDFQSTYRGRPKSDAEPLNLKKILAMSIMMRSHFGEQEGDFKLAMRSIAAHKYSNSDNQLKSVVTDHTQESKDNVEKGSISAASKGGWLSWLGCVL